jgi:hypothetical protein
MNDGFHRSAGGSDDKHSFIKFSEGARVDPASGFDGFAAAEISRCSGKAVEGEYPKGSTRWLLLVKTLPLSVSGAIGGDDDVVGRMGEPQPFRRLRRRRSGPASHAWSSDQRVDPVDCDFAQTAARKMDVR